MDDIQQKTIADPLIIVDSEPLSHTSIITNHTHKSQEVMWKKRKFPLQSGVELMTTHMIDVILTNRTTEAGVHEV